ncbi:MAG TPA: type II secretion system F family protein [Bryobacteraceae bacterium]|nr:type II secretion system F family protein [Bryobacteraceae bacterium]
MPIAALLAFVVIFGVVLLAVSVGLKYHEARRKKQVTDILQTVAGPEVVSTTRLLKDLEPPRSAGFERLLSSFQFSTRAAELIQQAGLDWEPSRLLTMMGMCAGVGMVVSMILPDVLGRLPQCLGLAVVGASLPYLFVCHKRKKRLAEMEEQLPDALDFLARSMRAGHAFTISLEMIGGEISDPLGQEFRTLFNEQNLGAPLDVALHNFNQRVTLLDARFFSSSVMLQRQTGGNLSEILARLAYLIRERFRLRGQVKAASAHGKMTSAVLTGMPIFTALGLMAISPAYLRGMANDPDGRLMIGGAVLAQVLGRMCIKKIVNIKV